jgi:GntR family transcriptional regulator
VFDIDVQGEPSVSAVAGGPSSSAVDSPDTVADRARQLGTDLLRFADQLSDPGR